MKTLKLIKLSSCLLSILFFSSAANAQTNHRHGPQGGCGYYSYGTATEMSKRIVSGQNIPRGIRDTLNSHRRNIESKIRFHPNDMPNFAYLDDSNSPNAFAYSAGSLSSKPYILLGENLVSELMGVEDSGYKSLVPVISVLMHEYAHVAQYARSADAGVWNIELMADHMAGWYIASVVNAEAINQQYRREDAYELLIKEALHTVFESGDYQFTNPKFHGTPQQRTTAFATGMRWYLHRDLSFWEAFNEASVRYGVAIR